MSNFTGGWHCQIGLKWHENFEEVLVKLNAVSTHELRPVHIVAITLLKLLKNGPVPTPKDVVEQAQEKTGRKFDNANLHALVNRVVRTLKAAPGNVVNMR